MCIESIGENSIPSYTVLEFGGLKFQLENVSPKESKRLTLKEIHENYLILLEYEEGKNPDVSNLIVFDTAKRIVAWERKDVKNVEVGRSAIKVPHQYLTKRIEHLDIGSGQPMELSGEFTNNRPDILLPAFYSAENEYFSTFTEFIQTHTNDQAILCCEYLEINSGMILSYYAKSNRSVDNNLLIMSNEGQLNELINIGKNLTGIGKDTFFVFDKYLIFISFKNTLNIYEI